MIMRTTTIILGLLYAAGAQAQTPVPSKAEPKRPIFTKAIPQLYFLKLQGLLQDAVVDPKAHRYEVKVRMRVKLDPSGAIIKWDWIDRAMGMPIYDRAVETLMAKYGPEGTARLPMATDPRLAEQVTKHGFMCQLKFHPDPAFDRARRAQIRANAPKSTPKNTQKITAPASVPASKAEEERSR